jgi:acyl-CoA thioester hydrolase
MRDLAGPHGVITPYEGTGHRGWDDDAPIPAPLCLHETPVKPEWVDYNKHMSESCYLLVFGDNADAFFRFFGIDEAYRASGRSFYTVQTQIHYLREAMQGDPLRLTVQLLDLDRKRAHVFQAMHHAASGELLCTAEQMLLHVDLNQGRAAPLPAELYGRLLAIRAAHAPLPTPPQAGRPIGIRRPSP